MNIVSLNCPSCGASYGGNVTSRFIVCEYCGTRFALSKEEMEQLGYTDEPAQQSYDADEEEYEDYYPDDTGSEPMSEFAPQAIEEFLDSGNADRSDFKSSPKILRGLGVEGEDVYLIHDDTLFKSGKNGFAITSSGLYCREMLESTVYYVSWDDFAQGSWPQVEDSYITQDDTKICYFSGDSDLIENDLLELYNRLYNHATKVC